MCTEPGTRGRLRGATLKELEARRAGAGGHPPGFSSPSTHIMRGQPQQAPVLGTGALGSLRRGSMSFLSLRAPPLPLGTRHPAQRGRRWARGPPSRSRARG